MYMRPGFAMLTPAIKNLIMANVFVFVIQLMFFGDGLYYLFGIVPAEIIRNFTIWQIGTYMFFHGGLGHLFLNMFALWMFGTELEGYWGTKEFLRFYFFTGLVAGVCIFFWNLLIGSLTVPTIGASGAVFGILIAFALFFPDRHIHVYFLFPVKAKHLTMFYALIEIFSLLSTSSGISHIGHVGGMITGFFYIRHRYRHQGIGQNFFRDFFRSSRRF